MRSSRQHTPPDLPPGRGRVQVSHTARPMMDGRVCISDIAIPACGVLNGHQPRYTYKQPNGLLIKWFHLVKVYSQWDRGRGGVKNEDEVELERDGKMEVRREDRVYGRPGQKSETEKMEPRRPLNGEEEVDEKTEEEKDDHIKLWHARLSLVMEVA